MVEPPYLEMLGEHRALTQVPMVGGRSREDKGVVRKSYPNRL